MRKSTQTWLIIFTIALVVAAWGIWFSGDIRVEKFLFLGLVIPLLFFLKNRFVIIVGLLTFQVLVSFIFIGNSDYAFIAIAALLGIVIAFENPMLMYIFVVIAMFVDISPIGFGYPLRTTIIVGSGLFIGWLFKEVLRPAVTKTRVAFPEAWPALILFLWFSLGYLIWCEDRTLGWLQYKYIIAGVFFFLITPYFINTKKKLDWAIFAWIIVGFIASAATFFGPSFGTAAQETKGWGVALGTFSSHKNWISALMSLSFFIILACYFWVKGIFKKLLLFISLPIILAVIIYQQSRAAGTVLGFCLILFWIADTVFGRLRRSTLKIIGRIFVLTATIVVLFIAIYYMGFIDFLGSYSELFAELGQVSTMQTRNDIWAMSYDMIKGENHPIRGLGPAAFWSFGTPYGISAYIGQETEEFLDMHPHNIYLDIYLHMGVIGLVSFLWIAVSVILKLWRNFIRQENNKYRYLSLGLFCSVLTFYIHGVVEFQYHNIVAFWAFLGFAIAAINILNTESTAPDLQNFQEIQ